MSLFLAHFNLFCLCGKKKLFKVVFVFLHFQGSPMQTHLDEKRGKTNERKILNSLSSFLDTKEHCWLLLHVTRKNIEYY